MQRISPYRSKSLQNGPGIKKSTIERLSQPKAKDPRWIPDKPSVYWLDYLIDPTPLTIMDPEELANYYDSFEPKYPRTRSLATPRKYYGTLYREDEFEIETSPLSGIPMAALTYNPTDRINQLASPKIFEDDLESPRPRSASSAGRLIPPRIWKPTGPQIYRYASKDDLASGDFRIRSRARVGSGSTNDEKPEESRSGSSMGSRTNRHSGGGDGGRHFSDDRRGNRNNRKSSPKPKKK